MILIGRGLDPRDPEGSERPGRVRRDLRGSGAEAERRRRRKPERDLWERPPKGTEAERYERAKRGHGQAAGSPDLCGFEGAKHPEVSGDNSLRDPPVPIPNTEVKPQHADSTWLETAR